jgi:hypothetical protein
MDGNERDSGEQKFSKVRGSRLGWYSGHRAIGHRVWCQLLSNFYQYGFRVYQPRGIYRIVTAESTFYTVLVVVPAYTTIQYMFASQLSNIGPGGKCCVDYTNLNFLPGIHRSKSIFL